MAATAVDRDILHASTFNTIKPFEEQEKAVDDDILTTIAKIFVQNKMHHRYGAGILHRHQELKDGSVMVHTVRNAEIDICQMQSLNSLDVSRLVPNSLFLNNEHNFQAFEYDIDGPDTAFDNKFMAHLRDFLIANSLEKLIAIIPNPAVDGGLDDSVEFMHLNGRGTVRVPRQAGVDATEPVVTGWSFHENEQGIIECKGNNVCSPKVNGHHQVFQDSKLHSVIT